MKFGVFVPILAVAAVLGVSAFARTQPSVSTAKNVEVPMSTHNVRQSVTYARVLPVSVDAAWSRMADADSWHDWAPFLSDSECESHAAGAARVCVMKDPTGQLDGYRLEEVILENNAQTRTFRYSIKNPPMPISDMEGTVEVLPHDGGTTLVQWTASFRVDETNTPMMRQAIVQFYQAGLMGLEQHAKSQRP